MRATAGSPGLIRDLGGHDLADILAALRATRETHDRPTVIFAYTIKGFGLEMAGRPMNHSALLTGEQVDRFRAACGLDPEHEMWDAFADDSAEAAACRAAAARLAREGPPTPAIPVPRTLTDRDGAPTATQAAFGRILLDLSRQDEIARRLVTVSPDVSVSTSLGG